MGMLKPCDEDFCNSEYIITFKQRHKGLRNKEKIVEKELYCICTRNKTGKKEIFTYSETANVLCKDLSHEIEANEIGPHQDYVSYKKQINSNALVDKKI